MNEDIQRISRANIQVDRRSEEMLMRKSPNGLGILVGVGLHWAKDI